MDEDTSLSEPQSSKENKVNKIPWPAHAEVFEVQEELGNEKNLAFLCKICIGKKIIHASRTSTANLRKHLTVSLFTVLLLFFA